MAIVSVEETELRSCFAVLDGMKRGRLHMDRPMAHLHAQLRGTFGG
ncbi:MAG: hypothetical protein JJE39_03505 [Vicinamibacteria bacterium]|nr:hypothetical protein [Vicinamibacteria bacterium]